MIRASVLESSVGKLADGGMSRRDTSARGARRSDRALKRHPVDILDTYQSSRRYPAGNSPVLDACFRTTYFEYQDALASPPRFASMDFSSQGVSRAMHVRARTSYNQGLMLISSGASSIASYFRREALLELRVELSSRLNQNNRKEHMFLHGVV